MRAYLFELIWFCAAPVVCMVAVNDCCWRGDCCVPDILIIDAFNVLPLLFAAGITLNPLLLLTNDVQDDNDFVGDWMFRFIFYALNNSSNLDRWIFHTFFFKKKYVFFLSFCCDIHDLHEYYRLFHVYDYFICTWCVEMLSLFCFTCILLSLSKCIWNDILTHPPKYWTCTMITCTFILAFFPTFTIDFSCCCCFSLFIFK